MRALTRWALLAMALMLSSPVWTLGCTPVRPWKQIMLLEHPEQGKQAEQTLRAMGPEGWRAIRMATRAIGHRKVVQTGFMLNKCPGMGFPTMGEPAPGEAAARLAIRWLTENPALDPDLIRSPSPTERSLALIVKLGRLSDLVEALGALEDEDSMEVLTSALSAADCGLMNAAIGGAKPEPKVLQAFFARKASLAQHLAQVASQRAEQQDLPAVNDCRDPKDGAGLLSPLLAGQVEVGGTSVSNGVMSIGIKVGGQSAGLGPACALWLYEQGASKGIHLPGLLTPLVGTMGMLDPTLRRKAADLLVRDVKRFPPKNRNRLLARAINAGATSPTRITWDGDALFPQTLELEAAARQGSAQAREAIDRAMLCRAAKGFADSGPLPLLGFLPSEQVADRIYRIGRECKRGATAALIALLRRGDPRAVELLDTVLASQGCCLPDGLFHALGEHAPPGVVARLEKAAGAGNPRAARLLEHVRSVAPASGGGS